MWWVVVRGWTYRFGPFRSVPELTIMACGRVIVGTARVVTLPADRLHSVGGHRGWSRSSTLAVVCYLAVEWERAP